MERLSAEEVIELASYIVGIVPDDLEQAQSQLEDLADLLSGYLKSHDEEDHNDAR